MIWSISALQDTTIYESDLYRNTGLDQILEIGKSGTSAGGDLAESRALIKFDISTLSNILTDNSISLNNISASLKLYTVQESELPQTYTIEAKALAASWSNGVGYFSNTIESAVTATAGATWLSTQGSGSSLWASSLTTGTDMDHNTTQGGGVWYTSSIASQSFSFKTMDTVNIDVTNIVKAWQTGSLTNNGFIVSLNNTAVQSANFPNTNIQFYSSETHTVFEPQLYISWTGSFSYNTGSLSVIKYEDNPIIYTRNFKSEYPKDAKVRILVASRPKYPRPTFAQNSDFITIKALPTTTYYQILDAHNDQIIIPYGEATKISTNTSGSYFDFYTTMMYPERYYKFEIKSVIDGVTEYFNSNDFTFKITK
jgi:hypothetical protein